MAALTDEPDDPTMDAQGSGAPDPRDRRKGPRRSGADRRAKSAEPGAEKRRGSDRRQGDRRAELEVPPEYRAGKRNINEYPLTEDELEFINVINAYKTKYRKPFPSWSEVLHILKALGYKKARGPGTLGSGGHGEIR